MKSDTEFGREPYGVLERLLAALSALPVAIVVIVTVMDVFARYLFSAPLRGSMEIIEFAMALIIFTALPLITRKRQHVSVSIVDGLFKGHAARCKLVLCDLLSVGALALLSWRLWVQGIDDMEAGAATEVLALPNAPLDFSLAALAGVSAIVAFRLMWHNAFNREGTV